MGNQTHGRNTAAYKKLEKEVMPVEKKVPNAFTREQWLQLSYEDQQDFVNKKKELVLAGLKKRLSSPVVSLIIDINDLEGKMVEQEALDREKGVPLSKEYMRAIGLKVELAKALKTITEKSGTIRHEHVMKKIDENEVIDVDFEMIVDKVVKDEGKTDKA